MESDETLRPTLINCLTQQLSEIEVLTCMYPNRNDVVFTDSRVLQHMKYFLDNVTHYKPNHLDFTLNLHIEKLKLEISINLPSFYPEEEPEIYVRCNQLNRQQETALNSDLSSYIKDNHLGEPCVYTAVSWIQDNFEKYKATIVIKPTTTTVVMNKNQGKDKFMRLWIFSHHIYNKKKREEIVKRAKIYNLTGFCLPGKPGIICVEGIEYDWREWWKIIKSLNWEKIVIRKSEIFDSCNKTKEQKFKNFEELSVFIKPTVKGTKHVDMSGFFKYIETFGLTQEFNDFFGLSNST